MLTSTTALFLDVNYQAISPDTNIESLYIERLKIVDTSKIHVERLSVYKHFPIGISDYYGDKQETYKFIVVANPEEHLYSGFNNSTNILKTLDSSNIIVHGIEKDTIKTSYVDEDRNLISCAHNSINLSLILYSFCQKQLFNAKFNDSSLKFKQFTTQINSSIATVLDSLNNLETLIIDTSSYVNDFVKKHYNDRLHKEDDGTYTIHHIQTYNDITLEPGIFYAVHYDNYDNVPSYTVHFPFVIILLAISEHSFAKKCWALPYNIASILFPGKISSHFEHSNLEAWELKYDYVDGKITYMKDEFGNEGPFDFKNYKVCYKCILGQSTGIEEDYSISGYVRNIKMNSILTNRNIELALPSEETPPENCTLENVYIGYYNSSIYIWTSARNGNIHIDNLNSSIRIDNGNNIKIGNSCSSINLVGNLYTTIELYCSSIFLNPSRFSYIDQKNTSILISNETAGGNWVPLYRNTIYLGCSDITIKEKNGITIDASTLHDNTIYMNNTSIRIKDESYNCNIFPNNLNVQCIKTHNINLLPGGYNIRKDFYHENNYSTIVNGNVEIITSQENPKDYYIDNDFEITKILFHDSSGDMICEFDDVNNYWRVPNTYATPSTGFVGNYIQLYFKKNNTGVIKSENIHLYGFNGIHLSSEITNLDAITLDSTYIEIKRYLKEIGNGKTFLDIEYNDELHLHYYVPILFYTPS